MAPWHQLLVAALFISGALAAAVSYAVWRNRPKKGATWLAITTFGFVPTAIAEGAILLSDGPGVALRLTGLGQIGMMIIAAGWLPFAARYTGKDEWLRAPYMALLWSVPVVYGLLALVKPRGFVYVDPVLTAQGSVTAEGWGPGAIAAFVYVFVVVWSAEVLLIRKAFRSRNVYRRRTVLFVLIGLVIYVGHIASVVGVGPFPNQSLAPMLFLLVGVVSLLVLHDDRYLRLLPVKPLFRLIKTPFEDIAPIARDVVIEEMGSGVVVLDGENRIVDLNPVARQMLEAEDRRIVGKRLRDVVNPEAFVNDDLSFLDVEVSAGRFTDIWVDPPDGPRRCFDIVLTDLGEKDRDVDGRVAIIHDVTRRQRRKQVLEQKTVELERQNEHLEEFASIVSHDLRNPLTVAIGQLEVAMEETDLEYLEAIQRAHERMEDIIEDVLTLAREGQTVESTESVSLREVVEHAWRTVDTDSARLELAVDEDVTVTADEGRLQRALENLFRNAVEHARDGADGPGHDGDTSLTITVGELADGFYVADDGPGIPPEERQRVLEQGFTTHEEGSGFGLSIVESIVEAHGWTIDVTESEDGGAQFEISGVGERIGATGELTLPE